MTLNRRQLVANLSLGAGALVLSPMLQHLRLQAAGIAASPRRFVFVVEGNGCPPNQVQPKNVPLARPDTKRVPSAGPDNKPGSPTNKPASKLNEVPMAEVELPPALEPVAEFKDRLTIVQGLSGRVCGGGHSNNFGALGAYPGKSGPLGETIDAALARALPAMFPHVALGIINNPMRAVTYNISASGPGRALPTQCRPVLAYNALFGSVANGTAKQAFSARTHLLDFMREDVKKVRGIVGGPEREKFESYVEAFEALSDRQSRLNQIESTLRKHAPVASNKYTSAVETDRLDAHFDVAAGALISGLTNVVTISSAAGEEHFGLIRFTGLGINLDNHSIGHNGSFEGKSAQELTTMIRRFHFELIARLAKKLQAVPEGNGTMLDNTCILYLSDSADGHHSTCWEWPVVMLGGLGGRLKAGRFLQFPNYGKPGHRTMASLYCTLLHAAGAPRDQFGAPDLKLPAADQKGPLTDLLTSG